MSDRFKSEKRRARVSLSQLTPLTDLDADDELLIDTSEVLHERITAEGASRLTNRTAKSDRRNDLSAS